MPPKTHPHVIDGELTAVIPSCPATEPAPKASAPGEAELDPGSLDPGAWLLGRLQRLLLLFSLL